MLKKRTLTALFLMGLAQVPANQCMHYLSNLPTNLPSKRLVLLGMGIMLLAKPIRSMYHSNDMYYLICAAGEGDLEQVRYYLGFVGNPNATIWHGRTALHEACSGGHLHIVEFLASQKASLDLHPARNIESPIGIACQKGYLEIVRFLVRSGVRFGKDSPGTAPLFLAYSHNQFAVADFLLQWLAVDQEMVDFAHNNLGPNPSPERLALRDAFIANKEERERRKTAVSLNAFEALKREKNVDILVTFAD